MLQEKIDSDLKDAMRAKDQIKLSTLRLLKAAVNNYAIEKRVDKLEDGEIIKVIQKQAKQRQDAIPSYEKGNRPELAQKEKDELAVLESYLPKQMTDQELLQIVAKTVAKLKVENRAQMSTVMKEVMAEVAGRADGKKVSAVVSQQLSS